MARKAVSKRQRFEVFKRDRFVCQYCGQSPPAVILHIDHIVPVSRGGDNAAANLITSCKDCNLGKSNVDLDQVIPAVQKNVAEGQEKLRQLRAFRKMVKAEQRELQLIADDVRDALGSTCSGEMELRSIRLFLSRLGFAEVIEAVGIAVSKKSDSSGLWKYFCGVCWKKIHQHEEGAA